MGTLNQDKPTIILAGIEQAESDRLVLKTALEEADRFVRAHVHAVHAFKAFGPMVFSDMPGTPPEPFTFRQAELRLRSYVQSIRRDLEAAAGRPLCERVETHISAEPPNEALSMMAEELEADLIVVGTHEHKGISRMWHGLTSEQVMRSAPCSVLIVKKPDRGLNVPEFAHACQRCIEVRQKTNGRNLWCVQHNEKHGPRHTYRFMSRPMG